jgi:hypothetical protein
LQDMLLGMFGCFFVFCFGLIFFFLYVIIRFSNVLAQQAIHLYNISFIVVSQGQSTHWWHKFKVKGHAMVKVDCQRNPYFLSSFHQINSKLCVKVAYGLPLSWLYFGPIGLDPHGSQCGSKIPYPKVKFWNRWNHTV